MGTLLFLIGSPLSAAKPVKTDVTKEKKVPRGKQTSPIVEETSDTTAPVITLNGSNPMDITQGDTFTDPNAIATDDTDGSVTVSASGSVDTSTVGTYTITYTASDSAGNSASKIRTVNIAIAPIVEETPICTVGDAALEGILKDSTTGVALANVKVSIGGCATTTDEQGFYTLQNIAVNERAIVTFKSDGYYTNSKIMSIKQYLDETTLTPNYLEFAIDKYGAQNNDYSQNEKLWQYSFGIKIPGGIYTDSNGNDYTGNVIASVAYEDVSTDKGRDAFPGAYEGKNSNGVVVPFVSYGFMVIDLNDETGAVLGTSDDIILTFNSAGATIEIIPLWYYDYTQGIWIEEGYATRLPDGKYGGTISHPGTWSLSQPIEDAPGIYTDRIVYTDGTPVKNLRVYAVGKNWIRTDLDTDENGVFEIEVIPDSNFQLKAYNYRDKCEAVYDGTIQAIASGETI